MERGRDKNYLPSLTSSVPFQRKSCRTFPRRTTYSYCGEKRTELICNTDTEDLIEQAGIIDVGLIEPLKWEWTPVAMGHKRRNDRYADKEKIMKYSKAKWNSLN